MERLRKCVACGNEDFEENINNFCCWCGKDIDTGLTLEEMEEKGIPYILDKRKINLQQNQENTGLEPSEVEQLKANQNKIAIEKLEKLKIKLNDFKVDNFSDACIVIKDMNFNINAMLAELKGGNNEKVNR